jgi:hypothetical protein
MNLSKGPTNDSGKTNNIVIWLINDIYSQDRLNLR